jgi:hypothetical protein
MAPNEKGGGVKSCGKKKEREMKSKKEKRENIFI